ELSRSPSNTLRAYLCRFTVRAPVISLEGFLDSVKSEASVLNFPPHHSSRLLNGFAYSTLLLLGRTRPAVRSSYPPASPHRSNDNEVVQLYQSVIHRLLLSASAYLPTNSERTSLPHGSFGFWLK